MLETVGLTLRHTEIACVEVGTHNLSEGMNILEVMIIVTNRVKTLEELVSSVAESSTSAILVTTLRAIMIVESLIALVEVSHIGGVSMSQLLDLLICTCNQLLSTCELSGHISVAGSKDLLSLLADHLVHMVGINMEIRVLDNGEIHLLVASIDKLIVTCTMSLLDLVEFDHGVLLPISLSEEANTICTDVSNVLALDLVSHLLHLHTKSSGGVDLALEETSTMGSSAHSAVMDLIKDDDCTETTIVAHIHHITLHRLTMTLRLIDVVDDVEVMLLHELLNVLKTVAVLLMEINMLLVLLAEFGHTKSDCLLMSSSLLMMLTLMCFSLHDKGLRTQSILLELE